LTHKPKISIVTVVFNAESTIRSTIQSVLNQNFNNMEYLLIDGKSTDNTINIIEEYKDKINIMISEKDDGIYDAMNKAIQLSDGEYIYFLNSDDIFYDEKTLSNIFDSLHNEYDVITCPVVVNSEKYNYTYLSNRRLIYKSLKKGKKIIHQGLIIKQKLIKELKGFDIRYKVCADFDLECRITKLNGIKSKHLDRPLCIFDADGVSNTIKAYVENFVILKKEFSLISGIIYFLKKFPIGIFKQIIFRNKLLLNTVIRISKNGKSK